MEEVLEIGAGGRHGRSRSAAFAKPILLLFFFLTQLAKPLFVLILQLDQSFQARRRHGFIGLCIENAFHPHFGDVVLHEQLNHVGSRSHRGDSASLTLANQLIRGEMSVSLRDIVIRGRFGGTGSSGRGRRSRRRRWRGGHVIDSGRRSGGGDRRRGAQSARRSALRSGGFGGGRGCGGGGVEGRNAREGAGRREKARWNSGGGGIALRSVGCGSL